MIVNCLIKIDGAHPRSNKCVVGKGQVEGIVEGGEPVLKEGGLCGCSVGEGLDVSQGLKAWK